jgi:RNA polymerase sigma factor (sigma-70 family)
MTASLMNPVLDHLRRAVLRRDGSGLTDGQLLESFISRRDEAAFEVLVRRHGPMVLGVCRRVLRDHHDAEDAFQATFLVLVRKAGSVVPREMVANWLHGVAYRTARKARALRARHHVRERQVTAMPEPGSVPPDNCWHDLQPVLDQELSRLPDKHRLPIVLCDLEGKTGKEAARQLGWPEGTLASRLSRGRALLAKRLTRRGLALSGGSLAAVLSGNAACASVPTALVSTTVKAASLLAAGQALTPGLISAKVSALAEGGLKVMFLTKVKITLLLGVIGIVAGTGLGGVSFGVAPNGHPGMLRGRQQIAQANAKQSRTVPAAQDKVRPDRPKGKNEQRVKRDAPDLRWEAFLMAFQISSEVAKAMSKKTPDPQKDRKRDRVQQILDMVLKGFQAYQDSKPSHRGKKNERAEKGAPDLYAQAFLKAFQVSSRMAKAMGKGRAKVTGEDQQAVDAFGPAFVQAYARAEALKKALGKRKGPDDKAADNAMEALDSFLQAGRPFEQAVKQRAKTRAVEQVRREIEDALAAVRRTAADRRVELEALEEIEELVRQIKKHLRERKAGK